MSESQFDGAALALPGVPRAWHASLCQASKWHFSLHLATAAAKETDGERLRVDRDRSEAEGEEQPLALVA